MQKDADKVLQKKLDEIKKDTDKQEDLIRKQAYDKIEELKEQGGNKAKDLVDGLFSKVFSSNGKYFAVN